MYKNINVCHLYPGQWCELQVRQNADTSNKVGTWLVIKIFIGDSYYLFKASFAQNLGEFLLHKVGKILLCDVRFNP